MSQHSRRSRLVLALAAGALAALVLPASPAAATVTCGDDGMNQPLVTLTAPGDRVALRVLGVNIQYDDGSGYQNCLNAISTSTAYIDVRDISGGNTRVTIDLSADAFAPGDVDEPGTSDEIEWKIAMGSGGRDRLRVVGGAGTDAVFFGKDGFNLNVNEDFAGGGFDNDALIFTGVNRVVLSGRDGDDELRASGDAGTGDPLGLRTIVYGGKGFDSISGGDGRDRLRGGRGTDEIGAGRGRDLVIGGRGADEMSGDRGDDTMRGGRGDDSLFGGRGDDSLNGGDDSDFCRGGAGFDTLESCET